jgi:hypothetical protein
MTWTYVSKAEKMTELIWSSLDVVALTPAYIEAGMPDVYFHSKNTDLVIFWRA